MKLAVLCNFPQRGQRLRGSHSGLVEWIRVLQRWVMSFGSQV
jgi:hypothetical protein